MKDVYGKQQYNVAYVDELPKSCMDCPFMRVDNKLWSVKDLSYISTQWCTFCVGEDYEHLHLEKRWMDKRDNNCPLREVKELINFTTCDEFPPLPDEKDIPPEDICDYYNCTVLTTDEWIECGGLDMLPKQHVEKLTNMNNNL